MEPTFKLAGWAGKKHTGVVAVVIVGLLIGLQVSIWLDLKNLADHALRLQATELSNVIDAVRAMYADNIAARVAESPGKSQVLNNYRDVPGAIPIPATMAIELGERISEKVTNVRYGLVSDFPFKTRAERKLDAFEIGALRRLRRTPDDKVYEVSNSLFNRRMRLATPVIMRQPCVDCHNTHPDIPKHDWKIGDVRGLQIVSVILPITSNIFAFKYILIYMAIATAMGAGFIYLQKEQTALIAKINRELADSNNFLAKIAGKIAKYLSPQIYKSIFSGEKDVVVSTERKKLTIFFSNIKDFTDTTESLQPEEITKMLNEYLTEMSQIALKYGATIDKFIGDAILAFFGDPTTRGAKEDARAAVGMAIEMQKRLLEMNATWRNSGVERPFRVRLGINTGYCNVGNFGSNDRMDYTIIGAEVNLAARLETSAEPGGIVMSYETYALIHDMVQAKAMPPITMKGISREVVPYAVIGLVNKSEKSPSLINELGAGLSLVMDLDAMDHSAARHARERLETAIRAIDGRMDAAENG